MMIESWGDRRRAVTLGADKGYDAKTSSWKRELNVRPHVTQNTNGRRSAIDRRITRHRSYAMSQRIRKRIEEAFGWIRRWPACARPSSAAWREPIWLSGSR